MSEDSAEDADACLQQTTQDAAQRPQHDANADADAGEEAAQHAVQRSQHEDRAQQPPVLLRESAGSEQASGVQQGQRPGERAEGRQRQSGRRLGHQQQEGDEDEGSHVLRSEGAAVEAVHLHSSHVLRSEGAAVEAVHLHGGGSSGGPSHSGPDVSTQRHTVGAVGVERPCRRMRGASHTLSASLPVGACR
jgi:hypothetical protein